MPERAGENCTLGLSQEEAVLLPTSPRSVVNNLFMPLLLLPITKKMAMLPVSASSILLQGFALCHDAVVAWCIIYQLLRLAQLAEAIFAAVSR